MNGEDTEPRNEVAERAVSLEEEQGREFGNRAKSLEKIAHFSPLSRRLTGRGTT